MHIHANISHTVQYNFRRMIGRQTVIEQILNNVRICFW